MSSSRSCAPWHEDTSAAWGLFVGGNFGGLLGSRLPAAGREEVFAGGVAPVAGVFNPAGTATPVAGGFEVDGRWSFGSGVGHAGWVLANTRLVDEIIAVVVKPDELTIIDDWHVAGLRGTGSVSFTMSEVFVPEHRTFPFFGPSRIDEPKYGLPTMTIVGPAFAPSRWGLRSGRLTRSSGCCRSGSARRRRSSRRQLMR